MTDAASPVIDAKPTDDKARPKGFARVLGVFDTATKVIVTIYADEDGFSVISFTLDAPGPVAGEFTGATEIDTFTGSCPTFRLTYEAKAQGTADHPVHATVRPGMITSMNLPGQAYTGDGLDALTPPDGNQVEFLHNLNETFADATCGS
jgi:hypothetical protein